MILVVDSLLPRISGSPILSLGMTTGRFLAIDLSGSRIGRCLFDSMLSSLVWW